MCDQLPDHTSVLKHKTFIVRMLYSDYLHWQYSTLAFVVHCVTAFRPLFY